MAAIAAPAVLHHPFGGVAIGIEVHAAEGHGVRRTTGIRADTLFLVHIERGAKQGTVVVLFFNFFNICREVSLKCSFCMTIRLIDPSMIVTFLKEIKHIILSYLQKWQLLNNRHQIIIRFDVEFIHILLEIRCHLGEFVYYHSLIASLFMATGNSPRHPEPTTNRVFFLYCWEEILSEI